MACGPKIEKIVWATIIIIFVILALCNIINEIILFKKAPVKTDTHYVTPWQPLPLPNILICPTNPINQIVAKTLDNDDVQYLTSMAIPSTSKLLSGYNPDNSTQDRLDKKYDNPGDLMKAYGSLGWQCSSIVEKCAFSGTNFDCCGYNLTVPSIFGPCVYLNVAGKTEVREAFLGLRYALAVTLLLRDAYSTVGTKTNDNLNSIIAKTRLNLFLVDRWKYAPVDAIPLTLNQDLEISVQLSEEVPTKNKALAFYEDFKMLKFYAAAVFAKEQNRNVKKQVIVSNPDCYALCAVLMVQQHCGCSLLYLPMVSEINTLSGFDRNNTNGDDKGNDNGRSCTFREVKDCAGPIIEKQEGQKANVWQGYSTAIYGIPFPHMHDHEKQSHESKASPMQRCQQECRQKFNRVPSFRYSANTRSYMRDTETQLKEGLVSTVTIYFTSQQVVVLMERFTGSLADLLTQIATTISIHVIIVIIIWLVVSGVKTLCCAGRCGKGHHTTVQPVHGGLSSPGGANRNTVGAKVD